MIAYLNGEYLEASEARISPFDRGFLFGDGIYEATVAYAGRPVALGLHLARMANGLEEIGMDNPMDEAGWRDLVGELLKRNGGGDLGVYLQISRGNEGRRFHGFPSDTAPTLFCLAQPIPALPSAFERSQETGQEVVTTPDLRWQRCHVKSTSLLGNVLAFQEGYSRGCDETILFNRHGELTEASSCNVFVVRDGVVATPPLDHQILPGITRHMIVEALGTEASLAVEERIVTMDEVNNADEVWLTNSIKHIVPVTEIDGKPVGDGAVGPVWERARQIYHQAMFTFP